MINKKIGFVILLLGFFISLFISLNFFKSERAGNLISSKIPVTPQTGSAIVQEPVSKEPKDQECPLNGQMFTKSDQSKWSKRRPLGVMIENHEEARPQSGLSAADVIYEIVAEGGITRFLVMYYCQDPSYIGPVRSARIYFIKLLAEYGDFPLYAHVGGANTDGAADALGEVNDLGWGLYNDLNQFAVPFPYFWRDYERLPNRATEHTMYSATAKLWEFAKSKRNLTNVDKKGKQWDEEFVKWKFKNDAVSSDRGKTSNISFGFWNQFASDYEVVWKYDVKENLYKRENGGSPHIDKNTGKQLTTKNVVVLFSQESPANDGYPGGHILYKLTGTGTGLLFQDGNAIKINWLKPKDEARMKFTDTSGGEVSLVRGKIWVEILPIGNNVTY